MPKVQQTIEDLRTHLDEQIRFLESSAERFDNGDFAEAKRMVVNLRTLLHDTQNQDGTPKSQSLLKILGIKDSILFIDTSSPKDAIGPYTGLVLKSVGPNGGRYVAPLDDFPPNHVSKNVSFDEYWNGDIFIDTKGNRFSRKILVLAIANKDGGAHIDPDLDQSYADLTKSNSLGWIFGNSVVSGPLENAAHAAIRQIVHEVLKSLIPNYPEKKLLNTSESIVLGGIHLAKDLMAGNMVGVDKENIIPKVGRNEKCPCGSESKYKKCHGK